MSCLNCEDMARVDDVEPPCREGSGCPVPPAPERALRVLRMRALMVMLQWMVDSSSVLNILEADEEDLEILAAVEDEVKRYYGEGKDE